ncbi:MAG: DUF4209 domain-containing protein [Sphingobacterium mizutaii]|nr:DUF4209 domain-containing protein [Sphingobacterium mizutaii]
MLSSSEFEILTKYQQELENINECTSLLLPKNFDYNISSEELRYKISLEFNALSYFEREHIIEVFGDNKEMLGQYLNERIKETNNNLLKAKYYHLLYFFSNNNKNINYAIEAYKMALEECLNNHGDLNRHIRFQEILNIVIELSKKFKYKTEEIKTQIFSYLESPDLYDRMKTWIIDSVVKSIFFKVQDLKNLPKLCIAIASRETKHRFIEINLPLALNIATKIQDNKLIEEINELLGDNDFKEIKEYDCRPESMAIPHQNNSKYIKIIQYYKKAKNKSKLESATLAYNNNKKQCKFIKTTNSSIINNRLTEEQINEAIISTSNQPPKSIMCNLIWGDILPLCPNEILDTYVDQNKNNFMLKLMKPVYHDINNNHQEITTRDYLRFNKYAETIPFTTYLVLEIILNALQNKRLSYGKTAKILSSDLFFGFPLTITRNDEDLKYTWFQMVDTGLKSFFDQCRLILTEKEPNWTITLDILSLKFEGILRDIIGLVDGVITKVDKQGNTVDLLLDDLLRNEVIEKIFTKDDINLFQFTLTNKGNNIRNNVAHSFYKPQDYSIQKVIMVLLCVLRLAKFRYVWAKKSIDQQLKYRST